MCKCGPHSAAQGLGWALFVSPVGYLSVLCITPLRVAPLFSLPDFFVGEHVYQMKARYGSSPSPPAFVALAWLLR